MHSDWLNLSHGLQCFITAQNIYSALTIYMRLPPAWKQFRNTQVDAFLSMTKVSQFLLVTFMNFLDQKNLDVSGIRTRTSEYRANALTTGPPPPLPFLWTLVDHGHFIAFHSISWSKAFVRSICPSKSFLGSKVRFVPLCGSTVSNRNF